MSTKNSAVSSVSATVAHIVDNSPTGAVDVGATLTQAAIAEGVRKVLTMDHVAAATAGYNVGWNEVIADAISVGTKAGKGDAKKALLSKIRAVTAENLKSLLLTAK
jgi:hypothetical protein